MILIAAWPAHAAIAHVQSVSCFANSTSTCTTAGITSTTGNLFVAGSSIFDGAFTSITDSKSNTYSNAVARGPWSVFVDMRQDFVLSGAGGAAHTFTITTSGTFSVMSASEITGAASLDEVQSNDDSGTSHTSNATAATDQANELLIGVGGSAEDSTYTTDTGAGWVERINIPFIAGSGQTGLLTGTRVVSATGTYAYTFTTSASTTAAATITTWRESASRQRCIGCGIDKKVIGE